MQWWLKVEKKKKSLTKINLRLTSDFSLKNEEEKDDSDPGGGIHTEKGSIKASDSMESLYSLNSGQSSSSKYKISILLIQYLVQ